MKVTQGLLCVSMLPSFSVLAVATSEENAAMVNAGLKDMFHLSAFLKPEDKDRVQEDLKAAAIEALSNDDRVLREVYPLLFKFGSALRRDVVAHNRLRQALTQSSENIPVDVFLEITEACAASEVVLEQMVFEMKESVKALINSLATEEGRDLDEVYKHYAPLFAFLSSLHTSLQMRMGQARLIQARRALEGAFLQGKTDVEEMIHTLNKMLQLIFYNLQNQDDLLLRTARQAVEAKVLFRAALSFLTGVMKSDSPL
ncbi:hypothetical protein ACSSS7_003827 [Eimeria intestinalis]